VEIKMNILEKYIELTDIMLNAIKVDDFDIFENTLKKRGKLIDDNSPLDPDRIGEEDKKNYSMMISALENQIEHEMKRFEKVIAERYNDTKRKTSELTTKSQVKKYVSYTSNKQGNFFDQQK